MFQRLFQVQRRSSWNSACKDDSINVYRLLELRGLFQASRNMRLLLAVVVLLFTSLPALSEEQVKIPEPDRVRIAEVYRLADEIGNKVWSNWDKAPFAILLVTPDVEFLIRHPNPTKDFTPVGFDSLLKSNVYYRKRTQPTNFLAAFPAVNGVSTIVAGQAERTQAKTSTNWVVTILHEHFHQLQDSQPNAFSEVNALNLSRGDQTGMWMLNYPFPYEADEMKQQFNLLTRSLAAAVQSKGKRDFKQNLAEYMRVRRELNEKLSTDNYKYMAFQLWKEGTARYTEYKVAKVAAKQFKPSKEFAALKDFKSFEAVADEVLKGIIHELSTLKIEEYKRVAFYPLGAGDALLLDQENPKWQERYFKEKFDLSKYFSSN